MTATIEGLKQLQFNLKSLDKKVQEKLTRASMTASLRIIAKAIKSEVPSTWKEGRKAIGWSFKKGKARSQHKGVTFAKAGVGAGIKKAKRAKAGKGRGNRAGVGMGVSNFHWFVLGTAERLTGNPVRHTGKMRPNPIVKRGTLKSKAAALAAMAKSLQTGIEREAAKGK